MISKPPGAGSARGLTVPTDELFATRLLSYQLARRKAVNSSELPWALLVAKQWHTVQKQ